MAVPSTPARILMPPVGAVVVWTLVLSSPAAAALACMLAPALPAAATPLREAPAQAPEGRPPGQAYGAHMQQGYRQLQAGELEGAIEQFAAALALRPGDLQAAFLLGTAQRTAGRLDEAARTFEQLSADHPAAPNGPFGVGQVELLRGDAAAAEAQLREALRRDADYVRAWFFLGEALLAQELGAEAAGAYREALRRNPTGRPSAVALARILLAGDADDGASQEALDVLRPVLRASPEDPVATSLTSIALARLRRFDEASALLQGAPAGAVSADDWFNLGLLAAQTEAWEHAEPALERALRDDPAHVPTRMLLSELLETSGRPQHAEEVLQEGIALRGNDRTLRRALAALYINRNARQMSDATDILRRLLAEAPDDDDVRRALATVYADTGQLEPALQLFGELERRSPDDAGIAYRIGYLHSHLGDNDAARAALQRALRSAPGMIDALYELGVIDLREERFEEALARLEQVAEADPYRTGAHVNMARALRVLGREDEAQRAATRARELQLLEAEIEDLRSQVRLRPGEASGYVALAELLIQTGETGEAASLLRTALRIDPELQQARDLLRGLQGLRP